MISETKMAPTVFATLSSYLEEQEITPLFLLGDALFILEQLPSACIDFCMTSPPYWNKRQYHNGGIGLEENFQDYISNIVKLSAQIMTHIVWN